MTTMQLFAADLCSLSLLKLGFHFEKIFRLLQSGMLGFKQLLRNLANILGKGYLRFTVNISFVHLNHIMCNAGHTKKDLFKENDTLIPNVF